MNPPIIPQSFRVTIDGEAVAWGEADGIHFAPDWNAEKVFELLQRRGSWVFEATLDPRLTSVVGIEVQIL